MKQQTGKGMLDMTIKEVCEKFDLSPDTLRYYERAGVIPEVRRTKGGIRDYSEDDVKWVENAVCMRGAGVPIEMLIEYVRLFQMGDKTIEARRDLLLEVRNGIQEKLDQYQATMDRINYKISRYEEAVKTGVLSWDAEDVKKDSAK
jgi:DNA-binding transcriptional MerR regulator